ncbi:hypothetical protein D8B26_005181 [Coccidioides posadasii str. Silveira]|uniref:Uncharacterized protein n=3 Tax=Coccidioides posadasii TaxID=199306 RepID=E9D644_COCPS|nr:Cytochrome P450 family protein [Coccidioides posadasii C735 delta SOWgp]EER24493.1 Cytochrome P450 family protein [Coccidioides posadasii C735 delta SOWgp]EFW18388.1 hypothetical protein CPSG_05074 [Coccidioides posadasii str. Silveira]KMM66229.1 cytochrome P450 52A12 [Coccidioides posadasii RMSCC 3488]QVM10523.1 hypothetical protein D8B26_005181 [Coccidioides posadasii str. Silveira]|eukprot:XP_003066638.1 Cytochrome P450 family protein [Coccidioides posadasii C735 delta SOWgp]
MLNLTNILLIPPAAGALHVGYRYLQSYLEAERIRKLENTEDPPKAPNQGIFGINVYRDIAKHKEEHVFLQKNLERYDELGDTYTSDMFGRTYIDTRDPENIKAILSTQFEQFSLGDSRLDAFYPMLGEGIFTHVYGGGSKGEPWRHSRAVLRPQFARHQIQDLAKLEEFVQNLISRIPRNETCDLQELFFRLTLDTATDFLFGESVNSLLPDSPPKETQFYHDFTRGTEICMLRTLLGDLYFLQKDSSEFKRVSAFVQEYIDRFTHKALELHAAGKPTSYDSNGKYVFLEEISKSIRDPVRLRSELLNILLAGRDTTASLLSACFHQLARHKDVWDELRKEIMDNVGDRLPTYEDIKSLRYLRYVLNETLRLFPVVPWNGREAVVTTTLPRGGGPDGKSKILVKKGTFVLYSTWGLHRSKFYGEDTNEFRPSRWETIRPGWNYIPFNGGPRICLGQQYALVEASYVITRLLQVFKDIENRDPVLPFVEHTTLTLSSEHGAKVALTPA